MSRPLSISPEGEGWADAVQGSKLPTEGGKPLVQGYVLTVHDFCHERLRVGALAGISANQASMLALAAPKIQSSITVIRPLYVVLVAWVVFISTYYCIDGRIGSKISSRRL